MEHSTLSFLEASCEVGTRDSGFWAIALMSVLQKWYVVVVVVGLLQEEPEPIERKDLHVGAESVNCEHMQALVTNVLQIHWEWQEDWREAWVGFFKYQTASCDQLGRADCLRRGQTVRGVMDIDKRGNSTRGDNTSQKKKSLRDSVEAPVLWRRVAKYVSTIDSLV